MVYIQIESLDGTIVGAEAIAEPVFVKWQEKNRIKVICPLKEAQGIIGKDGNTIYQLSERESLKGVEENILSASFIDELDYEMLKSQLDDPVEGNKNDVPEDAGDEQDDGQVMSATQMRARIIALENTVAGLTANTSDEATAKFYATLADKDTNSIAKIRAAAQQYLDDTANVVENEGGE